MENMKNNERVLSDKGLAFIKELAKTKVEISNIIAECESKKIKK